MENEVKPKETRSTSYIYVLYKWRKFLAINILVIIVMVSVYSLILPNIYKATASIIIPPENSMGISGLGGLLSGKSSSIGSKLFGITSASEDILLGILNSRTAISKVIKDFQLMNYYEIDDGNIDKALKLFKNDLSFEANEFGIVEINVLNEDPLMSAKIANYFAILVDSLNISINSSTAKNNRMFIEKRYFQNLYDLKKAEDSLYKFQKKYGIVAVPEQLQVTVKAAAEIESELLKKEMQSFFVLQGYGENSPQYQGIQSEIDLLKKKVMELKNSPNLGLSSNILFPFKNMPDIAIQYLRTSREVEIQQSILELVMPMYEQAKVEEQKSIPTVVVIDQAVAPQIKYAPKRSFIVIGVSILGFFVLILLVYRIEFVLNYLVISNPLEQRESRIYNKIIRFYGISIK